MDASIVSWIITGVIGFILLTSVLWGIKRGLKKSVFRFVWLLATAALLFFATPLISGAVNEIDISSLNISVFGKVSKISDVGVNIVRNFAGSEQLENNPELLNLAQSLSIVVLNIVIFVLLFWVLKILLWIVWAPIAHKLFDKQAIAKKKFKKEQRLKLKKANGIDIPKEEEPILLSIKENKHRGWGALMGLLTGLVIVACTFMPVIGVNKIFQNVYANVLYEENGKSEPYLNQVLDEEMLGYVNSYENSLANQVLTYTGINAVSNFVFKNMATIKIGKGKLYVEGLIDKGVKIYSKVMVISKFDKDNITSDKLAEVLTATREILAEIKDVQALYVLADGISPKLIKDYVNSSEFNDNIDSIAKDIVNNDEVDLTLTSLFNQIDAVLKIAQELNSKDLIATFINEKEITFDFVVSTLSDKILNVEGFTNNIFDNFNEITILESEYPEILDKGFEMLFNMIDIEYVSQSSNEISVETVKTGLKTIFENVLNLIKLYSKSVDLDFDASSNSEVMTASLVGPKYDKTRQALNCVGEILNVIRTKRDTIEEEKLNFLNETNYATLIGSLKNLIDDKTSGIIDVSSISNSLGLVDNWKDELNNFAVLYKAIINVINSGEDFDTLKLESNTLLNDIGKGIGVAVENSKLVNNANIRQIFKVLVADEHDEDYNENFAYVTESFKNILNINIDDFTTVREAILNNIYNPSPSAIKKSNVGTNWENEIICLKKLLNSNFNDFELGDIGETLDTVTQSKIFTKDVMNAVVISTIDDSINSMFGYNTDNPMPDGNLKSAITLLKNNLKLTSLDETFSYANEFVLLQGLFDTVDASYSYDSVNDRTAEEVKLLAMGNQFDKLTKLGEYKEDEQIVPSKILTKEVINGLLKHYFNDYIGNLTGIDGGVVTIVNKIMNNLDLIESYEIELGNIINLAKTLNASTVNLETLGANLDTIKANSKIITSSIITEFIDYYFEDLTKDYLTNYETVISKIRNRINSASSYEAVFSELKEITDNLSSFNSISTTNLEDSGDFLDTLADMSQACDEFIAKDVANIFVNRLKANYTENPTALDAINGALETSGFDISANKYNGSYETLFQNVLNALD